MFKHNFRGVSETMKYDPIPEGDYALTLTEAKEGKTKNGDPMVNVTLVVSGGEYDGRKVFHNVTFLPKEHRAAGMAKHWLKAISQPFEDEVDVNPEEWRGAAVRAHVGISEYKGNMKNEITEVYVEEKAEEVPF